MHPPFAKLMLGAAGWFAGFDGNFQFENIGDSYTNNHVPYVGIRALPAAFGALTVPVVYATMKESGLLDHRIRILRHSYTVRCASKRQS